MDVPIMDSVGEGPNGQGQNERQKRMMGRSNLHGAEWGTGRSAAVSFTAAIWFVTLGVSFIALILWI